MPHNINQEEEKQKENSQIMMIKEEKNQKIKKGILILSHKP